MAQPGAPARMGGVQLTPAEQDRLLLFTVAELARARRARGLRLNVPEATALIADAVAEAARDGRRHDEALEIGRSLLGPDDVLPGVADLLADVKVEAVFDDGTRLVVVPDPIGGGHLGAQAPGAVEVAADADAATPLARPSAAVDSTWSSSTSTNTATVPITVTSHFHFLEVNPRLSFDRAAAYGRHLDIPAGSTLTFAPGETVRGARSCRSVGSASSSGSRASSTARSTPRARASARWSCCAPPGSSTRGRRRSHDAEGAVARVRAHLAEHPEVQS